MYLGQILSNSRSTHCRKEDSEVFFSILFLLRKGELQIEKRTEKGIGIKNNVDENTNIRSCVIQMDNGNDFYSIE